MGVGQLLLEALRRLAQRGDPRLVRALAASGFVPAVQAGRVPRLVVVGAGGSGKSTLLKQLLARAAGEGRVPVWLPLAALPTDGALTPATLIDQLVVQARTQLGVDEAHAAFFEALARDGQLVFGLDALDECGSLARRQKVRGLIVEAARQWPRCQFLVTSRPEALLETPLPLIDADGKPEVGFLALALEPFARDDVKPFLTHAFSDGAALADQLLARNDVDALLATPLTLVLVGLVARAARGLPAGRTPLFARCIETVCDTWEDAKGGPAPDGLDAVQRLDVLRRLGWASQCVHGQPLPARVARTALAAAPGVGSPTRAQAVVDGLARRNLLLRSDSDTSGGLGVRSIGFAHAQFREYLAGAHFADWFAVDAAAATAAMAPHWFDTGWLEVLRFAADLLAAEPDLRDALLAAAHTAEDPYRDLLHRPDLLTARLLVGLPEAEAQRVAAVVSALEPLASDEPALCEAVAALLLGLAHHPPALPAIERFARGEGAGRVFADDPQLPEAQRLDALRWRLRAVEAVAQARGAAAAAVLADALPAPGPGGALALGELQVRLGRREVAVQAWQTIFATDDPALRAALAESMDRAGDAARFDLWLAERLHKAPVVLADVQLARARGLRADYAALWGALIERARQALRQLDPDAYFAPPELAETVYALLEPADGQTVPELPLARELLLDALRHPAAVWFVALRLGRAWPELSAEATRRLGDYVLAALGDSLQRRPDFSRMNGAVHVICDEPDDSVAVPILLQLLARFPRASGRESWPVEVARSLARRGQAVQGLAALRPHLALPGSGGAGEVMADKRQWAWAIACEFGLAPVLALLDALYRSGAPEEDAAHLAAVWRASGVSAVAAQWFDALAQGAAGGGRHFLQELHAVAPDDEPGELAHRVLEGAPEPAPAPERRRWTATDAAQAFECALERGWYISENDEEESATPGEMLALLVEAAASDAAAAVALADRWVQAGLQPGAGTAAERAAALGDRLSALAWHGWALPAWAPAVAALARQVDAADRAGLVRWLNAHAEPTGS